MASELNVLARALNRLSERDRRFRDFTLNGLRRALTEVIACFPVYRTYVTRTARAPRMPSLVDAAIAEARRRNPVQEPSIFEFIRQALLPGSNRADGLAGTATRDRRLAFAHEFQQYTAPVVAKGVEDTAFYNDVLLVSANEVGGDLRIGPRHRCAVSCTTNAPAAARWPLEMTAASTHDTKRGEDARARINVLVGAAGRVARARQALVGDHRRCSSEGCGRGRQIANDEWLFYQALVGAWPAEALNAAVPTACADDFVERMQRYMRKALKEAKRHTGWLHENPDYEHACGAFRRERAARATRRGLSSRRSCRSSAASRGSGC